jgi:hypothetical protein
VNVFGAFRGDYISAVEFGGRTPTLTIREVRVVELEDEKGVKRGRPVVFFSDVRRGWVLCKTTAHCLAAMFTAETATWAGKRVTLYEAQVQVGKERRPGIRVLGSPDIDKPVVFELRLPRKKPIRMSMKPTPKGEIVSPEEPEIVDEAPPPRPDDIPGWEVDGTVSP